VSNRKPLLRCIGGFVRCQLGEGPVWDERTDSLYWVDIETGELHQWRADGSHAQAIRLGERIGCIALRRREPGFIAALERRIAFVTFDPLRIETVVALEPDVMSNRSNDGKCDRAGRFWVGTCDDACVSRTAWLYRIDNSGVPTRTCGPFICTNGPAFSADGATIYWVDSYARSIYRGKVSPTGEIHSQVLFVKFIDPAWGYPDGLTCDIDRCVWVAHWGGARVSRFGLQGELLDCIQIPTSQVTSCTFGGANFRTLFVTSASKGLIPSADASGLAGAVFAVELDIGGLPADRYDG
jgi:D-xylonolactonase